MKLRNFNHSLPQQPNLLGTIAYWSVFAMINSDREPGVLDKI